MADREPTKWITVNGAHVPIFEDGGGSSDKKDIRTYKVAGELKAKKSAEEMLGLGKNSLTIKETARNQYNLLYDGTVVGTVEMAATSRQGRMTLDHNAVKNAQKKKDKLKDQINKEADEKEKQIAKNKEERDKLSENEKSSRGKGLSTAGQAIADRQSELKAQLKSLDKQRFNKQARPVIEELEARLKAYTRYQNAHYSSSDNEKYYKDLIAREKQITKTDAFNPEAKSTLRKLRAEIEEWKKIKRNVEHDD